MLAAEPQNCWTAQLRCNNAAAGPVILPGADFVKPTPVPHSGHQPHNYSTPRQISWPLRLPCLHLAKEGNCGWAGQVFMALPPFGHLVRELLVRKAISDPTSNKARSLDRSKSLDDLKRS